MRAKLLPSPSVSLQSILDDLSDFAIFGGIEQLKKALK